MSGWRTDSVLERVPHRRSRRRIRRFCEMLSYPPVIAAALLTVGIEAVPMLLQSRPGWQSLALNPRWSLETHSHSCLMVALSLVAGLVAPLLLRKLRSGWLRVLRSAVAFAAGIAMIQLAANSAPIHWPGAFRQVLEIEGMSLVEVRESGLVLRSTPSRDAPVVAETFPGLRFPLMQSAETRTAGRWIRVAVSPGQFAWLPAGDASALRTASHQIVPAQLRVFEAVDLYAAGWGVVLSLAVFVRSRPARVRSRLA